MATNRPSLFCAPTITGILGSAVGFAAALTPSLLPHALTFMLLLTALGTITGYAIGTTVIWALNKIPAVCRWHRPTWLRIGLPIIFWIPAVIFIPIAVNWQREQQSALKMPAPLASSLVIFFVTLVIAAVFLLVGRLLRRASNGLADLFGRIRALTKWARSRRFAAAVMFIALGYGLIQGGIAGIYAFYNGINSSATDQSPTNLGLNSGSAGSLTPWETLGREGRYYVDNTMTPANISLITAKPAVTPTRIYVGMQQANTPQERSDMAVAELDRVGAWDRKYLIIFGLTGTGWVDPDAINSLEAVTSGDVTTVAVQYSAVPSWMGFLLDPKTTQVQNASMVHTVLDAWRAKPADKRPELILYGESLGSFGTQGAWTASDTPESVTTDISRIIWVGPPSQSVLWKQWQSTRTGGPAWQPIVGDGTIAKTYIDVSELVTASSDSGRRITFVAHPNDPVVYWAPDLLLHKPDWLYPPLGPGVDPEMRWYPIITYLQVGMDLISGGGPPEVAHNYSTANGPAVALTVAADGWTAANTAVLESMLPSLRYVTG